MSAPGNGVGFKVALKSLGIGAALLGTTGSVGAADASSAPIKFSQEQREFYEKQIQPVLADNCFKCHSHQAEKIKGSLVLDSREGALKGGETGPAIVPGDAEKSLLIRAVRHVDEDLQMPPKRQVPEAQIALLTEWVKMGAPYGDGSSVEGRGSSPEPKGRRPTTEDRAWWSYQPLRKVQVPAVKDSGWSRNPIDKFVFARLKTEGMPPAPEADKAALIRRVYFDLIGLPPTAEEVEKFVADKSPDAYEKIVAGLLASPRYGEKWARHWLDLVRYAESDGYKADTFRPNAWRYRDYVIRSL